MKRRSVSAMLLLASLGGGCMSSGPKKEALSGIYNQKVNVQTARGIQGPDGQEIPLRKNGNGYFGPTANAVNDGNYIARSSGDGLEQAAWVPGSKLLSRPIAGGCTNCGSGGDGMVSGGMPMVSGPTMGMPMGSPMGMPGQGMQGPGMMPPPKYPTYYPWSGILPVPGMAPPGAVAAVGALPYRSGTSPVNSRSSVKFVDPAGMKITWVGSRGWSSTPLQTPGSFNFGQGGIYRLKLTNIPNRPGLQLYPSMEVLPVSGKTAEFLAHNSVPVSFSEDDFEQVAAGNMLVKVVYLPDPQYQDLSSIAGPNEIVSSRLEPGVDPIQEARRRGSILLILRMGNIDLQLPNSPAMDAPNPYVQPIPVPKPVMPGIPSMVPGAPPISGVPLANPSPAKNPNKVPSLSTSPVPNKINLRPDQLP